MLRIFLKKQKGASMVEYGALVALIVAISIVSIQSIGQSTSIGFSKVAAVLPAE